MTFYSLGDDKPQLLGGGHFIAESADIIGKVTLNHQVSVWFQAVLRGDGDSIVIGENSNIQDGSVLHVDPGFALTIGKNVTVGHKALLHGCQVGDNSLIGMNAVIMNGAVVGKNCLVAANALLTERSIFPDGCLIMGSPAKVKRLLSEEEQAKLLQSAQVYMDKAQYYRQQLLSHSIAD